jgi:protein-export membrane protein SecD
LGYNKPAVNIDFMVKSKSYSQIRSKIRWGIVGIFILLAAAISYDAPAYVNKGIDKINSVTHIGVPKLPEKSFLLGLDLEGGAELIFQADVSKIENSEQGAAVDGVKDVIERRVNAVGVGEADVRTSKVGDNFRVSVSLPGVTDVKEAISMIGATPILEFKEENTEPPRELTKEEIKQMNEYNADAKKRANEALKKIKSGAGFDVVSKEFSEDEISKNNNGYAGYLNSSKYPETVDWAKSHKEGEITKELLISTDGYNILKLGKTKKSEDKVTASHILICYLGSSNCEQTLYTKEEAQKKAQEIFEKANAENFAELAKEFSTDAGSAEAGGDLGTFGKGMMVPEFENAVFGAQDGQIVGPVETQFGFHIIYRRETPVDYEVWRVFVKTKSELDILPPVDPWKVTGLSGQQLERAEVVTDGQTGAVQVSLKFNDEGKKLFADLTEKHVGKPIAIFLDGVPISIPTVQQAIRDGKAVITGNFVVAEAKLLSQRLNAGALPVPVELISQQSVGATLGKISLEQSLKAGIFGILLVMIFMIGFYRLPGFLATIALTVYIALTLAIFKLIGVTLTLAGIAGFILSIGMAVDANVLIFERMKEELRDGKSLKAAVEEGFVRAWLSIRDGNVSTLISCVVLIWLGSGFIQGFAVTLSIGILVSMFTAITITRIMLRFIITWFNEKGNALFLGSQKHEQ